MNWVKNLFRGRLNRAQYIIGIILSVILFGLVCAGGLALVSLIYKLTNIYILNSGIIMLFMGLLYLLGAIIGVSLSIRRLHDIGASGYWTLLGFIPLVNVVFGASMLLRKGDVGVNAYGLEPSGGLFNSFKFAIGVYPQGQLGNAGITEPTLPKWVKVLLSLIAIGISIYLIIFLVAFSEILYSLYNPDQQAENTPTPQNYCEESGGLLFTNGDWVTCPAGCQDAACLPVSHLKSILPANYVSNTCYSSSNGDVYQKGYTYGIYGGGTSEEFTLQTDYCATDNQLNKFSCSDKQSSTSEGISCNCKDGACVKR